MGKAKERDNKWPGEDEPIPAAELDGRQQKSNFGRKRE